MDKLIYQLAITLIEGVGCKTAKKLIAYCGGEEAFFKESKKNLTRIPGLNKRFIDGINRNKIFERAAKEKEFIDESRIQPLFYLDKDYPYRLKHCDDGPLMIFVKGNANLNSKRILAIVGTRKPTDYGKDQCVKMIDGLSEYDIMVVSGLAYGIDTTAHRCSLNNGLYTIGVLGHGLDIIYPAMNLGLAREMENSGALVSEFFTQTKPDRENFPKRNRIVAGMVDGVVVIESAERGGALITADIALSYNRDVMAIPGKVCDKYSGGCNWLILDNKAALIRGYEDVIKIMNWNKGQVNKQKSLDFDLLSVEESRIMKILYEYSKISFDKIVYLSGIIPGRLPKILLELEMKGLIKNNPGNIYQVIK